MERTEDFRLTSTPRPLLIACAVLILLRLVLAYSDWQKPPERGRPVHWTDAAKYVPAPGDSKKLRLVEFYADWCTPCQRMERDVLTNDEIRTAIEKNFIALRVTDRQREDGKNAPLTAELLKKYRIFAFPTLVAVDTDGEAVQMLVGNSSSLSVYRFISRVLSDAQAQAQQASSKK